MLLSRNLFLLLFTVGCLDKSLHVQDGSKINVELYKDLSIKYIMVVSPGSACAVCLIGLCFLLEAFDQFLLCSGHTEFMPLTLCFTGTRTQSQVQKRGGFGKRHLPPVPQCPDL